MCVFPLPFVSIEETIAFYLDSMLNYENQHDVTDQRTSQWIDDIRSVLLICTVL